jgi:hypothetical protein
MPCRIQKGTFQNVSDGDGCREKPREYLVHATSVTDRNISISVGGIGCSIGLVGCLKTNMGDNKIRQKKNLARIQVSVITILLFMQ